MTEKAPMNSTGYFLRPLSPLVFRSGRPFGQADAHGGGVGYDFPLPPTVAGALRGAWVDALAHRLTANDQTMLDLEVHGALRARRAHSAMGEAGPIHLFAPRPADAEYLALDRRGGWDLQPLAPATAAMGGCDLPNQLTPVMSDSLAPPVDGPRDWNLNALAQWMACQLGNLTSGQALGALRHAKRTHVAVDAGKLTSIEGALFQSAGLDFDGAAAEEGVVAWLRSRRFGLDTSVLAGRHARLGADGRCAALQALGPQALIAPVQCPAPLADALDGLQAGDRFRLLLLTPACYLRNGWYPDGLRADTERARIEGCLTILQPPRLSKAAPASAECESARAKPWRLRLVAAALGPWQPLAASKLRQVDGALGFTRRPLRRLAPAGTVYWLEILERGCTPLSRAWMQSTCRTEYARDGLGLALPGLCTE